MGWTVEGTKRYLSEFGLKPVLSRISTEHGRVYLSEQLQVDPNNILNSNSYSYYIYSEDNKVKALLITTSIEDKKYLKQAEAKFTRLVKSLVKQTTVGGASADLMLVNNYAESVGEHTFQIERDSLNHHGFLRCVVSLSEDKAMAKQWVDKIDYHPELCTGSELRMSA